MESRNLLIYFYKKYNGDWKKIYDAVSAKEEVDITVAEAEVRSFKVDHPHLITLLDENFPETLKHVMHPPFVFELATAVESEAKKNIDALLPKIGNKIVIVENYVMADVIRDAGNTVAVKFPGYITIADKDHTVYYKEGTDEGHLAMRHAHMGKKILVTDGTENFKPTLAAAMAAGADVYAVPGNSGSETNKLIKEGAALCDCPDDLKWED